ncbi:nonstructural protein NSs [Guaroa virus]|uniref:Non-structural protein NS-S n=1 Tax=Guaroa virus TaxID=80941 RepID=A0A0E3TUI1_9VIRU|nr:nonstructural protein NSs [Guaroa virus]AKC42496.1 nonstructural protein NSs [Guaroa virus]AKC42508.1 nonstructural protein NSs [Guaroa virus]
MQQVRLTRSSNMLHLNVQTQQGLITTILESSISMGRDPKILSLREVNNRLSLTLEAGEFLWLIHIFLETGTVQSSMIHSHFIE